MNSEFDADWSGEPQWRVAYIPQRVTATGALVRDRGTTPSSWYLTPWEADDALVGGPDFTRLVNRLDPRLPHAVVNHPGPATVTLTCTHCGLTGGGPADFIRHATACSPAAGTGVPGSDERQTGTHGAEAAPAPPVPATPEAEVWTVHVTFDVVAGDRRRAEQLAAERAGAIGGQVRRVAKHTPQPARRIPDGEHIRHTSQGGPS